MTWSLGRGVWDVESGVEEPGETEINGAGPMRGGANEPGGPMSVGQLRAGRE